MSRANGRNLVLDLLNNPHINTGSPAWDALRRFVSNRLRTALTEEADRLILAASGNYGPLCPLHTILDDIHRQQNDAERRRIFNLRNGANFQQNQRRTEAFTTNTNTGKKKKKKKNGLLVQNEPNNVFLKIQFPGRPSDSSRVCDVPYGSLHPSRRTSSTARSHSDLEPMNRNRVDVAQQNRGVTGPEPENRTAQRRPPGNELGKLASNHAETQKHRHKCVFIYGRWVLHNITVCALFCIPGQPSQQYLRFGTDTTAGARGQGYRTSATIRRGCQTSSK